ncbi:hypothetical protein ACHAWF_009359 [Thalassiosira exigua]
MVEFGKRLREECAREGPEWGRHCIDYGALKRLVEGKAGGGGGDVEGGVDDSARSGGGGPSSPFRGGGEDRGGPPSPSREMAIVRGSVVESYGIVDPSAAVGSSLSSTVRFRYELDREIEKAVLFVLREQGSIASELDDLAAGRARLVDDARELFHNLSSSAPPPAPQGASEVRALLSRLEGIHRGYVLCSRSVLRFVAFVDLNVTAVRKILKKHDKKFPERTLKRTYLSAYADEYVDSHLDQLYNDGGLSSLVVTLRRAFGELHRLELALLAASSSRGGADGSPEKADGGGRGHRRIQSSPFGEPASPSKYGTAQPGFPPPPPPSRNSTPLRSSFAAKAVAGPGGGGGAPPRARLTRPREPLLQLIQSSRAKLKQNAKYVDIVAAQALFFEEEEDDDDAGSAGGDADGGAEAGSRRPEVHGPSSFLNLCSTFLYMTNYYIVAPTCGQYAARVGSTESMAGIVIGMTPNAALIATVLYGWWTSRSYKAALVFAASCSVIGNIFYGLALKYDSIHMIMIGRFFNGFGSARSINRRFIADAFSKRERTAAASAFVTAGALGMAFGPAMAAIFSHLTFPADGLVWQLETAPAWAMLFLWSVFFIASIVFFEDPDRSHLFGPKPAAVELVEAKHGEGKHLLADAVSSGELEPPRPPLYKNVPVMATLWIYFVLKLVLEGLMSSCPTLTSYHFGWDSGHSGAFLAVLGLLMFPANLVVARLSLRFEDRELIYYSLVAILISLVGFINYVPETKYSAVRYMIFGVCIFISTNALEGPNMGLLSKTIPKSWAKGIINTGFLATEAGTAARSVGDVMITLAVESDGVSGLLDALFVPMLCMVAMTVAMVRRYWDKLLEDDEDDNSDSNSDKKQ